VKHINLWVFSTYKHNSNMSPAHAGGGRLAFGHQLSARGVRVE
jgi:hypothetical protein